MARPAPVKADAPKLTARSRPAPANRNKTSAQLKREEIVRNARPESGVFEKKRWTREDVERVRDIGSRPAPLFRVGQTAYAKPSALGPLDNRPTGPLTGSDALAAKYRIWMRSPRYIALDSGERLDVGGGGVGFYSPSLRSPDEKVRKAAQDRLIASYRAAITPALEQYERGRVRAFQENIPGIAESFQRINTLKGQEEATLEEQSRIAAQYDPLEVRSLYTEPISPWRESVSTFQAERIYGMQPGSSIYGYRGGKEGDKYSIPLQFGENPSLGFGKRKGRNDEEQWMERPQLRRLDRGKIAAQLYASGLPDAARRAGLSMDIPLISDKGLPSGVSRQQMMAEVYQDAYDAYLESVNGWRKLIADEGSRDFVKTYARNAGIDLEKGLPLEAYGDLAISSELPEGMKDVSGPLEGVSLSDLRVVRRAKEDGKDYAFIRSPTSDVITKVEVKKGRGGVEYVDSQRWEDTFTMADLRNVGMSIVASMIYGPEGDKTGELTDFSQEIRDVTKDISGWVANNSKPIAGKPRSIYAGGYRRTEDGYIDDAVSDWVDESLGSVTKTAWNAYVKKVNEYLKSPEYRAAQSPLISIPLETGAYAINFIDRVANGDDASAALFDSFRASMGKPVIMPTSSLPAEYREYAFGRDKEAMATVIAQKIADSKSDKPTALTKSLRDVLEAQAIAATGAKLTASEAAGLTDTQLMDIGYGGNTEVEQILQNAGRNIAEIPALPAGILAIGEQVGQASGGTREQQVKAVETVLDPILKYWQAWGNAALWSASAGQLGEVESLKREAYNNPLWTGLSAVQGAGIAARMATIVGRAGLVSKMGRVGAAYNDLANTERVIARFPTSDPLVAAGADARPRTGKDGAVALADLTEDELATYKLDLRRWRSLPDDIRRNTPEPRAEDYFDVPAQVARILGDSGVSLGYARPNIVSQIRKRLQKNLFESKSSIGQRYRDFVLSNRGKDIVNDAQRVARALADDRVQPLITELQKLPRFERARAVFDLLVATDVAIPERFGVDIGVDAITPGLIAEKLQENLDAGVIVYWDADEGTLVTRNISTPEKAQLTANIKFLENLDKADSQRGTALFNEIRAQARLVEADNILMIQAMGVGGDISRRLEDISMLGMRDATRAFGDAARGRVLAEKEQLAETIDYNEALLESGAFAESPLFQTAAQYSTDVEGLPLSSPEMLDSAASAGVAVRDAGGFVEDAAKLVRGETDLTPEEVGPGRAGIVVSVDPQLLPPRRKRGKKIRQDEAERIIEQNIVMALAGIDHASWYRQAADAIKQITNNPQDAALVAAIIAVTSAQRKILPNIGDLRSLFLAMKDLEGQNVILKDVPQIGKLTWLNADRFKKLQELHDTGVVGWLFRGAKGRADIPLDSAEAIDRIALEMSGKSLGDLLENRKLFNAFRRGGRNDVKTSRFFYGIFKNIDPEFADELADLLGISKRGSTADVWDMAAKRIFPYAPKEKIVGSAARTEAAEFAHQVNRATLRQLQRIADELGDEDFKRIVDSMDEDGVQAAVWVGARNAAEEGWQPGVPMTLDDMEIAQRARERSYGVREDGGETVATYTTAFRTPGIGETIAVTAAPGAKAAPEVQARWAEMTPRQREVATRDVAAAVRDYLQENNLISFIDSFGDDIVDGVRVPTITIRVSGRRDFSVEKLVDATSKTSRRTVLLRLAKRGYAPTLSEIRAVYGGSKKEAGILSAIKFAIKNSETADNYWEIIDGSVARVGQQLGQDAIEYSKTIGFNELNTQKVVSLGNAIFFNFISGKRPTAAQIQRITQSVADTLAESGMPNAVVTYRHIRGGEGVVHIDVDVDASTLNDAEKQLVRGAMGGIDSRDPQSIARILEAKNEPNVAITAAAEALDGLDFIGPTKSILRFDTKTIRRSEYASRIRTGSRRASDESIPEQRRRTLGQREAAAAERIGATARGEEIAPALFRSEGERVLARAFFQADDAAGLNPRGAIGRDARNLSSGQYILFLFRNQADVSTLIHELVGHVIARDLYAVSPTDLKNLEDFIGKKYTDWTRADHERIANIAEEYFRTGRVPVENRKGRQASNVKLGRAMKRIKTIIGDIYHSVAYTTPGQPRATTRTAPGQRLETDVITPEVRAVFDKYFGVPPSAKLKPLKSKVRSEIRNAAIVAGIAVDDVEAVLSVLDARAYTWAKLTGNKAADWYSDPRGAGISRAVARTRVEELDAGKVMRDLYEAQKRDRMLDERLVFIENAAQERMRRILRESPESAALFAPTFGKFPGGLDPAMPSGGVQTGKGKLGRRGRRRSTTAIELGKFLLPARDTLDEAAYISSVLRNARVPTEIYEYLVAVMRAFKQDGIILNNPEAVRWAKGEVDPNDWAVIQVDSFAGGKRVDSVRTEDIRRILGAEADLTDERKFANVAREIVKEYGLNELDENATYILVPRNMYSGAVNQTEFLAKGLGTITKLTRGWQRLALTTLPRTPIANIVGSGVLAATRGFSPQALRKAIAIARGTDPTQWPPEIRNMGLYGALLGPADAIKNDTVRGLYAPISAWMELMHKGNVMGEDFARLVVFVQAIMEEANKAEGKRFLAGLRRMNDDAQVLFDYVMAGGDSTQANVIRERALRSVEDWVGRYQRGGKFEQMLSTLVPFNQWYRHILRLYYLTMPFNYPGRSAVMAGLSQMGADYLLEHGVYPEWYMDIVPTGEEERDVVDYLSTGETGVIGQEREVSGIRTQALNPFATAAMIAEPRSTLLRSLNPFLTLVMSAVTGQVPKPGSKFGFGPAIAGQDINGSPVYLKYGANTDTLKFILKLLEDRAVPLGILKEGGRFDTSSMAIEAIRTAAGLDVDTKLYEGPSGASSEESVAPSRVELTPETVFLRFLGLSPIVTDAGGIASLSRTMKAMQRRSKPPKEAVVSG